MPPMWVAVPDGPPEAAELTDPYESQLGGLPKVPQWAQFDKARAKCGVCGYPMYLLLQAFCPSEDLERIFLVFVCNTAACQKEPSKSWQAWRLQRQAPDDAEGQEGEDANSAEGADKGERNPSLCVTGHACPP
eukprot:RCo002798